MLEPVREFRVGRPQVFAGLLLLAFLVQCLWVAGSRKFSDLEYQYIASGDRLRPGQRFRVTSPATGLIAVLPLRFTAVLRRIAPLRMQSALAIPHPWLVRLPFVVFGVWLGAAVWWVARRLFGDEGGYVALSLYCFSPAMVTISSNIGPEILLAWSGFGLVYTAIGVAHTVYASPRKWAPRIVLLGISIGICLATALWSFTLVLLAFAFMLYLTPGRRRAVLVVLSSASAMGLGILGLVGWMVGSIGWGAKVLITPRPYLELLRNLGFVFTDGYVLAGLFLFALVAYGSWPRARYFGNTAPLIASFLMVLFALGGAIYRQDPSLELSFVGLSFVFLFIGGIAADLLETQARRTFAFFFVCVVVIKAISGLIMLGRWTQQNFL
jgi:hypothetical protein